MLPDPNDSQPPPPIAAIQNWEQVFERVRLRAGFVLAPIVFAAVWATSFPALSPEAHRLAAVMAAVVVLWVTEALPMPVTALCGAAACVLLRVAPAKEVFAPFADPLMFLFIGSFIIARAIFLHGLDRRLAFGVLSLNWVAASPSRILLAFGAVTAVASAWMSNTATTAMMFAIGLSILRFFSDQAERGGPALDPRYATGMMLMTSFAASIGGLATPIGTPPNLIGLATIRRDTGIEVPFLNWAFIGVPVVVCLFAFLFIYLNWFCPAGMRRLEGMDDLLRHQRQRLGRWTTGQRSTLVAFILTVAMWVVPGIIALVAGERSELYQAINLSLPETVAAILGAALLFLLPGNDGRRALSWQEAVQIDWGVVLLYGGGVALGTLAVSTGLTEAIGRSMTAWLPTSSGWGLLAAATLAAVMVSEATSNTASATIVVPLAIAIAHAAGADPLEPAIGATLGSSLGFMLPVSTPCNAIVYGSGYIPLARMIRYGLLLDIAGVAVVVLLVRLLSPFVR